ncbi:MAG: hypothetical protein WDW36_003355 [Sanguina aurantia]
MNPNKGFNRCDISQEFSDKSIDAQRRQDRIRREKPDRSIITQPPPRAQQARSRKGRRRGLDNRLAAKLEPRASAPHRRIRAIRTLADAGVSVGVLVAPVIPALNDKDMEEILAQAADAGARCAGYTTVRLPHELKTLFREWLALHAPQRTAHVMSLVQQMNGGRDYDSDFATRMHGQGVFADLLRQRFALATRRHGYAPTREIELDTTRFVPPRKASPQGDLF